MSSWTELSCLAILAAACAPSCGSNHDANAPAGAGGASAAHTVVGPGPGPASSSSGAGDAGGCANPPPPPAGVPDGWIQPPGAPCDCDVYMSPDAAHMRPPSPWTSCGGGCLELVRDWTSDPVYTFYESHGAAKDGVRYIGYKRWLKHAGPEEIQLIRLPENKVVFDAFQVTGEESFSWVADVLHVAVTRTLIQIFGTFPADTSAAHTLMFTIQPDAAIPTLPTLSYDRTEGVTAAPADSAVSPDLWAISVQPPYAWYWHGPSPSSQIHVAYSGETDPGGGLVDGLQAIGANVFFHEHTGAVDDILVFDPAGGDRKLVTFPSALLGGACGLRSDGATMVWYQGGPIRADGNYTSVNLMAAPFATNAADLKPHVVRPSYRNWLGACGGIMSGGYDLAEEVHDTGANNRVILTRLADGYYWVIPPRAPKRSWNGLLYVDSEEFAIVETNDDGYHAGDWTIVRRAIASLGPPRAPGSGFDP